MKTYCPLSAICDILFRIPPHPMVLPKSKQLNVLNVVTKGQILHFPKAKVFDLPNSLSSKCFFKMQHISPLTHCQLTRCQPSNVLNSFQTT